MKYPLVENTINLSFNENIVRVWLNKKADGYRNEEVIASRIKMFYNSSAMEGRESLLDFIASFPEVNAVEVQDAKGEERYGTVVYTVPFCEKCGVETKKQEV